jgi:hypothetical protein
MKDQDTIHLSLFNASLFAKHLEAAYIKMHERYQADLGPDHIIIV